jgi:hypothetical protein
MYLLSFTNFCRISVASLFCSLIAGLLFVPFSKLILRILRHCEESDQAKLAARIDTVCACPIVKFDFFVESMWAVVAKKWRKGRNTKDAFFDADPIQTLIGKPSLIYRALYMDALSVQASLVKGRQPENGQMGIGMGNSLLERFRSFFVVSESVSAAVDATQSLPRLKQINQRKANQNHEDESEVAVIEHSRSSAETGGNHDNHGVAHWTFNSDKMIRQTVRRSDQLNGVAVGFEVDPH